MAPNNKRKYFIPLKFYNRSNSLMQSFVCEFSDLYEKLILYKK